MLPVLLLALTLDPPVPAPEVEPNNTRATATPVTLTVMGGGGAPVLTGLSRGSATTGTTDLTRDYWLITLTTDPLIIYRHSLTLATTGTSGHTGSIAGHQRTGDVDNGDGTITPGVEDPATIAILQSTSISTTPPRTSVFYSLGQAAPWLLYRVIGTPSTTSNYTLTLASVPVTPTDIACPFAAGPVTVTTAGQGHTTNTELFLYDALTLQPVPTASNDDPLAGSSQSTLTRTLPAGRYLLAVANFDTAHSQPPAADDRTRFSSVMYLADAPGLLVNSSATAAADLSFALTDTLKTKAVTAAKPGAYGVAFYTFTVATPKCNRSDIGRQGGEAGSDGVLDGNDFIVFINGFFAGDLAAVDVGQQGGTAGADGLLDNNDFIIFINIFFTNCNCTN